MMMAEREGDAAALAMSEMHGPRDPELAAALDGLVWLRAAGALGGVAEIIRERKRQVELGFTVAHDDRHENGWLLHETAMRPLEAIGRLLDGTGGYEDVEKALRVSGALGAAEIDRLERELTLKEVGNAVDTGADQGNS
jgi:hypothetical protein